MKSKSVVPNLWHCPSSEEIVLTADTKDCTPGTSEWTASVGLLWTLVGLILSKWAYLVHVEIVN